MGAVAGRLSDQPLLLGQQAPVLAPAVTEIPLLALQPLAFGPQHRQPLRRLGVLELGGQGRLPLPAQPVLPVAEQAVEEPAQAGPLQTGHILLFLL